MGKDEVFIFIGERNPLLIDIYFCTRDLVDYTMVITFV